MQVADKRIAIIAPQDYLSQIPSLVAAIRYMAQQGVSVDVVCGYDSRRSLPEFEDEQIQLFPVKARSVDSSVRCLPFVIHMVTRGFSAFKDRQYKCIIGVDPQGLVAAYVLSKVKNSSLAYLSLELSDSKRLRSFRQRLWKRVERFVNKRSRITLVQDTERSSHIVEDNRISYSQIRIFPNSYLGTAQQKRSDFLNTKLSIPETNRIILHAGLISRQMRCLELAEAAQNWPDGWTLVLHGSKAEGEDDYLRKLDLLVDGHKIFLSLDGVPDNELDTLFASAYVGLVFYRKDLGPNFTNIVGASGKLLMMLKCGVPVVTVDLPGLERLMMKYKCGISVVDEADIAGAVHEISMDYEGYAARAVNCYNRNSTL